MAITIESAAEAWMLHLQTRKRRPCKMATLRTFRSYLDAHILPHLGQLEVGNVGVAVLRQFISQLDSAGLSPKSQVEITSCVKSIVASVCDAEGEPLYPRKWNNERLDLPIVNPTEQSTPTVTHEQIESALKNSEEPHKSLYACLAGSGLRIGEALAITLMDDGVGTFFDPATATIHVRQSLFRGVAQLPKTLAGIRTVEVSRELAATLAEFAGNRDGFLFGNGAPLNKSTAQKYLEKQKLPGFHSFRRFRATTLRANQVPEDITRYWLGHSAGSITDRYSKLGLDQQVRREWADKVGLGFQLF
jgi:integrase